MTTETFKPNTLKENRADRFEGDVRTINAEAFPKKILLPSTAGFFVSEHREELERKLLTWIDDNGNGNENPAFVRISRQT